MSFIRLLFTFLIAISCHAQSSDTASLKKTEIKFLELIHDFGDIKEGDEVSWTFKFYNTGSGSLSISDVRTTCGCTVPEWDSTRTYLPGEQGEIKIKLNTKDKKGLYNKPFYVFSNAYNSPIGITIRANILKRKFLKIFQNRNKH